uniref:Pericentrin n=1 Tax=Mesocestoides corti TaxID=53468 RepID=A0A5K3FN12_MESCO
MSQTTQPQLIPISSMNSKKPFKSYAQRPQRQIVVEEHQSDISVPPNGVSSQETPTDASLSFRTPTPTDYEAAVKTSCLLTRVQDIKQRLAEVTNELTPMVLPVATSDVVTAVTVGQQEVSHRLASPSVSSITSTTCNNGGDCTSSGCSCCEGMLNYLASLTSDNASFDQPQWQNLKTLLSGRRPTKYTSGCPNIEVVLKELVAVASELSTSTVPVTEMQEMEKRLMEADAEVLRLQNQTQALQKLLDDSFFGQPLSGHMQPRQRVASEDLSHASGNSESVVAWLDLAVSPFTFSDAESERRQASTPYKHPGDQAIDAKASLDALIAAKKTELAEVRRDTINWDSKHSLICEKQAEIQDLMEAVAKAFPSNDDTAIVEVTDLSDEDTTIDVPRIQSTSPCSVTVEELVNKAESLRSDLEGFDKSTASHHADKLQPSLVALSDALKSVLVEVCPDALESPTNAKLSYFKDALGKLKAEVNNLRNQQIEVRSAACSLGEFMAKQLAELQDTVVMNEARQFQEEEDLQAVLDEVLERTFNTQIDSAVPRHELLRQMFEAQELEIGQLHSEIEGKQVELEGLQQTLSSLEQELASNTEAAQVLCESRLELIERVASLTADDLPGGRFNEFLSELRQNGTLVDHLKNVDLFNEVLAERITDWLNKREGDNKLALAQKQSEIDLLLVRLAEEEELLKSNADEAEELRTQLMMLQQSVQSPPTSTEKAVETASDQEHDESSPLLRSFQDTTQGTQLSPADKALSLGSDDFEPFTGAAQAAAVTDLTPVRAGFDEPGQIVEALKAQVNSHVDRISQLEAQLCTQNEAFKSQLAEASDRASQFTVIQSAYETDIQQLKTVLRHKTDEIVNLTNMLSSSRREVEELVRTIGSLKDDTEALKIELKSAQEETAARTHELEHAQGVLSERARELSDIREVVADYDDRLQNFRFVLHNKDKDLKERSKQLDALSSKLREKQSEVKAVTEDFAQLNGLFSRLWKNTLLVDESPSRDAGLALRDEPMHVLKASSAVDQFLGLLLSKEPDLVMGDLQAGVQAYKAFRQKHSPGTPRGDSSTFIRDESDLPWNPCCVAAVSAVGTSIGDPITFNLLRDLAYSESCRVCLANQLSKSESQVDQLKGMLTSLRAEVETNHLQLAERTRQLILLGIDPAERAATKSPETSGNQTICYVDTDEAIEAETTVPVLQRADDSVFWKDHAEQLELENVEKTGIIERLNKLYLDSKTSVSQMEQRCVEADWAKQKALEKLAQTETYLQKLIHDKSRTADQSKAESQISEEDEDERTGKISPDVETLAQMLDTNATEKDIIQKVQQMKEEILEKEAEEGRLRQQLHKIREKLLSTQSHLEEQWETAHKLQQATQQDIDEKQLYVNNLETIKQENEKEINRLREEQDKIQRQAQEKENQLYVNQANMVELEKRCECLASEKSAL